MLINFKHRAVIVPPGQFIDNALLRKLIKIYSHKGRNDEPAGLFAKEMVEIPELSRSLHPRPESNQRSPLNSLSDFQSIFSKPQGKDATQPVYSILDSIGQYKL